MVYESENADTFAGAWRGDEGQDVMAFTGDLAPHRAALATLAPHIHVAQARYNQAELEALVPAVEALAHEVAGVNVQGAWVNPMHNRAVLSVITARANELEMMLANTFGDRVELEVVATEEWRAAECGFTSWAVDGSGAQLTVMYSGGMDERRQELVIEETAEAVSVSVKLERYNGISAAVGVGHEVTGRLASPLAGRRVIDAIGGEERLEGRRSGLEAS